jgi:hypothetical protein
MIKGICGRVSIPSSFPMMKPCRCKVSKCVDECSIRHMYLPHKPPNTVFTSVYQCQAPKLKNPTSENAYRFWYKDKNPATGLLSLIAVLTPESSTLLISRLAHAHDDEPRVRPHVQYFVEGYLLSQDYLVPSHRVLFGSR